jgi:hypothetical protein
MKFCPHYRDLLFPLENANDAKVDARHYTCQCRAEALHSQRLLTVHARISLGPCLNGRRQSGIILAAISDLQRETTERPYRICRGM